MATINLPHNYGTSGSYLVANGTTSATWVQPNSNFVSNNGKAIMTIPHNEEKVVVAEKATLEVQGNLVINGVDLEERLKTIETVLNIPSRDVTMEAKYPKLAELYRQYMHELEKYKTWDRIKGDENATT